MNTKTRREIYIFFGNRKSILETFSYHYKSSKVYLVGCQGMNSVTEYKVITKKVWLKYLRMFWKINELFKFVVCQKALFPPNF